MVLSRTEIDTKTTKDGVRIKPTSVEELLAFVQDAGCTVANSGGGHYKVTYQGMTLGSMPATPHMGKRGIENSFAFFRRSLLEVIDREETERWQELTGTTNMLYTSSILSEMLTRSQHFFPTWWIRKISTPPSSQ